MIKVLSVVVCDICGHIQRAKPMAGSHNEMGYYVAPEGWVKSIINEDVHICPACAKKLSISHSDKPGGGKERG